MEAELGQPIHDVQRQWALEDQIEKKRPREKAFKLQEKLTEATIAQINAQLKAYSNGDALIKIDGAGLQPHLEAFMWEILRTIQVRGQRRRPKTLTRNMTPC